MKAKISLWMVLTSSLLAGELVGQGAQGILTLAWSDGLTHSNIVYQHLEGASVSIASDQIASVRSVVVQEHGQGVWLERKGYTNLVAGENWPSSPILVQGPAKFTLVNYKTGGGTPLPIDFIATIEIQPASYPPDKCLTIGSNAGNVRVTMENSTDLVNWTPAVNGTVYTNSPDARFFRIKVDK